MSRFNASDWYWFVGGVTTQVYSSARNIYVDAATDTNYQAFLGLGNQPNNTEDEAGIWHLMQNVVPLWLWNRTTFSQPAIGAYTKAQLQNYNANARFNKVTGGMTAAGIPVMTDDRSRGLIADARQAATADSNFTTQWYGSDGNFYAVDAPTMIQMSDTVVNHTNDCYVVFQQVSGEINTNTITTPAQIDNAYSSHKEPGSAFNE